MAAMAKKGKISHNLKKLVSSIMEVDLIEAEVKALKEGLIGKDVFDNLMSLKSKVSVAKRYTTLVKHVYETLQEKFNNLDVTWAVAEGLIEKYILVNITSLSERIPASLKVRYLILFLQPALQYKLEAFKLQLLVVQSIEYKDMWLKLNQYLEQGLIGESVLSHLFPEKENKQKFDQDEVKQLLSNQKESLNPGIMTYGKIVLTNMYPCKSGAITTLGSQHLSKLNELLASHSYKWKNIGVALNFHPQDLQTIEATPLLLPGAPQSYLIRLLQDWLQMTYGHSLPPTVKNLKMALSSQTVGLGALGSELEAIADKGAHPFPDFDIKQPYSSTRVSFDTKQPTFHPKYNEIYIEEGKSTLLEIEVTRRGKESLAYCWLRRGVTCDSQQPILCLKELDIAEDGENIFCEVKQSSTKPFSTVTVPITVHVSCPLDEFTPSLSSMYLHRPEVPQDTWPPTGSTKYINLAIIKQQKVNHGSEYVRCTIRGDIDDVLQDKETIDYAKLYNSLKSERQVIFIEGRPGSGKTTFVHKITRDWASNSSGGIRILLLVSLRVMNTMHNPNLSDILHLFKDLKVTSEVIEKRNGKGVCFIFDGFDEFSPNDGKDSIVHKIIDKDYLHQCTVVVASRPAALAKLRNKADRIVEVIGFLGNQIHEYFNHYPFSDSMKPEKLLAYLSLHPNILHMCYLPIHATMVAFLFEVTGQVPKTETEMYALFTRFTLMRCVSKNKELETNARDGILQCLNKDEKYYFKQICQLALDKTLLNKQVLHQDEIRSYFQNTQKGDISLGLITIDRIADLYGFKGGGTSRPLMVAKGPYFQNYYQQMLQTWYAYKVQ